MTEPPAIREYRYECAHGHQWVTRPVERMQCPACGTITLGRMKPPDAAVDALARELWIWRCEMEAKFGAVDLSGYPYERLIDVSKDDLRNLARRMAPHAVPQSPFATPAGGGR